MWGVNKLQVTKGWDMVGHVIDIGGKPCWAERDPKTGFMAVVWGQERATPNAGKGLTCLHNDSGVPRFFIEYAKGSPNDTTKSMDGSWEQFPVEKKTPDVPNT